MQVSRREFLKVMGAGASFLALGGLGGLGILATEKRSPSRNPEVSAQSAGQWSLSSNTTTVAIHASVLPSGKIFYFAGSGYHSSHQDGPFEARVLDPNTGSESSVSMSEDLFCAGQAPLPNGNILIAGGTLRYDIAPDNCNGKWHGLDTAYEFNWSTGELNKVQNMRHGRWYPTCVTMPNGDVMTTGGYDEYGDHNRLVETYNSSTRTWSVKSATSGGSTYTVGASAASSCPGAGSPSYNGASPNLFLYPRMHLMPSGNIVVAGMLDDIRLWNRTSGSWSTLGTFTPSYRHYGTSVLLPLENSSSEKGKILVVGGSPTSAEPATSQVQILDFNTGNPSRRTVDSLQYGRKYLAPVMLPDGKVLVVGGAGQGNSNPRRVPELFDPESETWTSLNAATVSRVYHQVALLLSDGRIWNAGSTPNRSTWELRTEIFSPAYYSATRPTISGSPTVGGYDNSITIPTPDASNISRATLVKCPDTTHHYDSNMRLVSLDVQSMTSSSVTVDAPLNANLAPPGYYYLHVLNGSNIPSRARIIRIPGSGSGGAGTPEIFYDVPSPGNAVGSLYSGASTRYGEEARVSSSVLVNKLLTKLTVRLRRGLSPSGNISAFVRNSGGTVVATFSETINASSLSTSFTNYSFTLGSPYTIKAGDMILVEYSGPARVEVEAWSTDQFDGSNTRRTRFDGTSYIGGNTSDIVGTMS
ncbi:MAG TPA: galactose oxidase-like domain-containing protein [Nitrososphaera sp.]|nr:galactose oxidase-like domain-containing protein [Nitrososphaera sp.]